MQLDKLEPQVIDEWYGRWLADGLSPSTVRVYHAILSAAYRQAVKWRLVDRAPTEYVTAPTPVDHPMIVPTPAQLSALVKVAQEDDPVLSTAIALAGLTGCRRGELVALRWSDVDMAAGRVRIARSLTVAAGQHHTGATKTHQIRDIALDALGVEVLRRRRAYMEDLSARAESPLVADPFVFSYNANGGRPVSLDTLTHSFERICSKLNLKFRFHDSRHFSVTTLIAEARALDLVGPSRGGTRAPRSSCCTTLASAGPSLGP